MASIPKRSRGLVTEVVCSPGEQDTVRAVSAVPPEQQRLVFGLSSPAVAHYSSQDPLFADLQAAQAIIFQDTRALGRLVKPRVLVDSPGELAPVSLVSLIYDYWQPASLDRKQELVQHLRIPLDTRYSSTSVFSIRAIVTAWPGGAVALPGRHEWSGSKTAAAVSQHQQRLDYIRTQQRLFTEGEGKDSPNRHLLARSDAEYTIDTGPEWEASSLSLTFNTAAELSWLQRIILKLLVLWKSPVDDSGGPIGDTSAEVTVSISPSSVGASPGLVVMASASPQPGPQGHCGQQQTTGGRVRQPAENKLPEAKQPKADTSPSCQTGGCVPDADAKCIGVVKPPSDVSAKSEGRFSPLIVSLANTGGGAGRCRRGAAQSARAGGGGGDSHGSSGGGSGSEDDGAACVRPGNGLERGETSGSGGGGTGRGSRNGGDRGDPGRERDRGQQDWGVSSNHVRKHKDTPQAELSDANGLEPHQRAGIAASSLPFSSHGHCDCEAATSLQDASSRSIIVDIADASSDMAHEQQVTGVANSKPTVKLIPHWVGVSYGDEDAPPSLAGHQSTNAGISQRSSRPCGGRGRGKTEEEDEAAASAEGFTSGCCGRTSSTGEVSDGDFGSVSASGRAVAAGVEDKGIVDARITEADDDRGRAPELSTSYLTCDDTVLVEPPAVALVSHTPPDKAARVTGLTTHPPVSRKTAAVLAVEAVAAVSPSSVVQPLVPQQAAFNTSLAALQLPPPPPPVSHHQPHPHQQQQRPFPNGATWLQAIAKGSPHAVEQAQAQVHAMGAPAVAHLSLMPHTSHHSLHGHSLPNGKARNGELSGDPSQWAHQLLPNLGTYGQSGSGSGTPPPGPQPPLHSAPTGHPHVFANGLAAALQNLLVAQQNGALQLQHHQGGALSSPQLQALYGLSHQQAHQQHQHQQLAMHQVMLLQHQMLQHAAHQQAQAQVQQQLLSQGLAGMQLLQHEPTYVMASPTGEPLAFYVAPSPPATSVESCALPADGTTTAHQQQQQYQQPQHQQGLAQAGQPLTALPIVAPTPAGAQHQVTSAHGGDGSMQLGWESGSASSVRSEPSTSVTTPLVERPLGLQHRVQSQGNMMAAAQGSGGSAQIASREGGGSSGVRNSYRGRSSYSGLGAAHNGPAIGGSSSSGANAAAQVLMTTGAGYGGNRSYGGLHTGSRHVGGGHGYPRGGGGGRYDHGSAEGSRPSSRGPNPHGGGGGSHQRNPHPADAVPPPDALPLPEAKGNCDLDRFISQIEPVIAIDPAKPPQQALQELRLRDLWNFYFEPSLYGREVFTLGGHRGASNSYFVPYLSAIQIFTRALPTDVGGTNRLYVSEDNQGWPKHMHLKFEHFEQELPFNRLPLYDQIEYLSSKMAAGMAGSGGGTSGVQAVGSRPAPVPNVVAATSPVAPLPPAARKEELRMEASEKTAQGSARSSSDIRSADTAVGAAELDEVKEGGSGAVASAAGNGDITQGATAAMGTQTPAAASVGAGTAAASNAAEETACVSATGSAVPAPDAEPSSNSTATGLLYDMRLLDVHPASWFAVAWYPVYRIPDAPLYARFLTFHSFAPLVESMRNLHERLAIGQVAPYYLLSLPVVGLNWYNMQGERWMEPLDESTVARAHNSAGPLPPVAASAPAASVNSPRGPHQQRGGASGGRVNGTDVWYQHLLQNYQATADRLARGVGLKVLGQRGAEEVRLRVPDYEFFRARA